MFSQVKVMDEEYPSPAVPTATLFGFGPRRMKTHLMVELV
jgi:hypothetical protein